MARTVSEAEKAKAYGNPAAVFRTPGDIVSAAGLTTGEKVKMLRTWEYDAREKQVAEEEGFTGPGNGSLLDSVLEALHSLGEGVDLEHSPPTKQGGV